MAEVRTTSSTGGQKGVKLARFDLIPIGPLTQLAEHFGVGASKYANHQWRNGYEWSKSYAALLRHLTAFWAGEDYDVCSNDPEGCSHVDVDGNPFVAVREDACFNHTGSHHMAAVAWHAFALMEFAARFPEHDDRYVASNALETEEDCCASHDEEDGDGSIYFAPVGTTELGPEWQNLGYIDGDDPGIFGKPDEKPLEDEPRFTATTFLPNAEVTLQHDALNPETYRLLIRPQPSDLHLFGGTNAYDEPEPPAEEPESIFGGPRAEGFMTRILDDLIARMGGGASAGIFAAETEVEWKDPEPKALEAATDALAKLQERGEAIFAPFPKVDITQFVDQVNDEVRMLAALTASPTLVEIVDATEARLRETYYALSGYGMPARFIAGVDIEDTSPEDPTRSFEEPELEEPTTTAAPSWLQRLVDPQRHEVWRGDLHPRG